MATEREIKAGGPEEKKPQDSPKDPPPRPDNQPITKEQRGKGSKPSRPENIQVTEAVEIKEEKD